MFKIAAERYLAACEKHRNTYSPKVALQNVLASYQFVVSQCICGNACKNKNRLEARFSFMFLSIPKYLLSNVCWI